MLVAVVAMRAAGPTPSLRPPAERGRCRRLIDGQQTIGRGGRRRANSTVTTSAFSAAHINGSTQQTLIDAVL